MIKMWYQWIMLICFWILVTLSIALWPSLNDINLELIDYGQEMTLHETEDVVSILLYKPFHFLLSILLLVFAMLGAAHIVRKVIYECRVAYMFKSFPYEPGILLLFVGLIYYKAYKTFPLLTMLLTLTVCLFELYFYISQKKSEVYYVREDIS